MTFLWGTSNGLLAPASAAIEWATATNGTPATETTLVRAPGTSAIRFNNTTGAENIQHTFRSAQGVCFCRWYICPVVTVASTRPICGVNAGANNKVTIRMTSTNIQLQLFNSEDTTQIGSNSGTLTANSYYRLELKIDSTTLASTSVEARLYDTDDSTLIWNPSGTMDLTANPDRWFTGCLSTSDANFDCVFTDMVIYDDSTNFCNTWPGPGYLIYLFPNGNGASSQFTGSDGNSTDNYLLVDDVTPDDATTYVESNTLDQIDSYTMTNCPAGMGANDTVVFVAPGVRFAISSTTGADPDAALRITSGGSTDETSAFSGAGSASYVSLQTATPRNYLLFANNSSYEQPGGSTPWTKTALDACEMGVRETVTDTHTIRISTLWLLIGVAPAVVGKAPPPFQKRTQIINKVRSR